MPPNLPPPLNSLRSNDSDENRYDIERRLSFLELTQEDAERLRLLAPLFETHARQFVDHFYRHLFQFQDTARFLQDERLVARLKELQLEHLQSMLHAEWGEEYVARRRRVGSAHAEKGIEPEFFLGSYQLYLSYYMDHLEEACRGDTHELVTRMRSLMKAVILDIGLTLDAYFFRLTNDLRTALDMYWRANAELRNFAQLASHDLKTPLATVANLCDEALDEFRDQMPEEACDLIERARQRSFRMSRMIDDLLAATLSNPGDEQLTEVPLAEVIADVLDRLQGPLTDRMVRVSQPDEWPTVLANRPRLTEALYNIVSNAVKFLDKQPGTIHLEVDHHDSETHVTIIDNGPGIPAEEIERIFNPFRRMPKHRALPGSGLGLYFTKNLIEQQGGRVWAESHEGDGARFIVALRRPPRSSAA